MSFNYTENAEGETTATFSITDDTQNGAFDRQSFKQSVRVSGISQPINDVQAAGDVVSTLFDGTLDNDDKIVFEVVAAAHTGVPAEIRPDEVVVTANPSFTKKEADGKKLFRRVHGIKKAIAAASGGSDGETVFDIVIPYNNCKINEIQIFWAPEGCCVDLKVYDTPQGHVQIGMGVPAQAVTPDLMLNQFGFNACVAKDVFKEKSSYDADLIKDMKVEVTLKNPTAETKDIGVNFILHELK